MGKIEKVDDCCQYVAGPESDIVVNELGCDTPCQTQPTNPCGLTHPKGSGTLAGCKSTTLPHFGIFIDVEGGSSDECRKFGYYTSGNTEEYENLCGGIDKLTSEEVEVPCDTKTVFSVESCDCFDNKEAASTVTPEKLQELEDKIEDNVDNTVVDTIIENGKVYNVLEDGTKVEVNDIAIDLEGNLVSNV